MQADITVIYRAGNRKSTETLGGILSVGNLKAYPHLLIVPLPMGTNYIETTTVGDLIHQTVLGTTSITIVQSCISCSYKIVPLDINPLRSRHISVTM